jgi:hypothetical protein
MKVADEGAGPSGQRDGSATDSRERKREMAAKIGFHNQTENHSAVYGEEFRLRELDCRLQRLSDRLQSFHASREVIDLKSRPHIVDWRSKIDAIRWMLRVAKHAERPARERILVTVENAIDQLEKVVEQTSHAA